MQLYCWNTDISAAFYVMLQFRELSVLNGAFEAIEAAFSPNWHLNRGIWHTLSIHKGSGCQPQVDLQRCANRLPTAGKVVAELKLVRWGSLFAEGQDARLWLPHFQRAFPGVDPQLTVEQARASMYADVEQVRRFRNRVAHHEPILSRDVADDRDRIARLIRWRRPGAAAWLAGVEQVSALRWPRDPEHTDQEPSSGRRGGLDHPSDLSVVCRRMGVMEAEFRVSTGALSAKPRDSNPTRAHGRHNSWGARPLRPLSVASWHASCAPQGAPIRSRNAASSSGAMCTRCRSSGKAPLLKSATYSRKAATRSRWRRAFSALKSR